MTMLRETAVYSLEGLIFASALLDRARLLFCFSPPTLTKCLVPVSKSTREERGGRAIYDRSGSFIHLRVRGQQRDRAVRDEKMRSSIKIGKILRASACWGAVIKNLCKFVAWCSAKSDFIKKSVQVYLDRIEDWGEVEFIFSTTVGGGCFGSSLPQVYAVCIW